MLKLRPSRVILLPRQINPIERCIFRHLYSVIPAILQGPRNLTWGEGINRVGRVRNDSRFYFENLGEARISKEIYNRISFRDIAM